MSGGFCATLYIRLFKDAVSYVYITLVTEEWIRMEHWWDQQCQGKNEVIGKKNCGSATLYHRKSHTA